MARTALVTGGTGMVGCCIANALLRRDYRVRALVRSLDKGKQRMRPECELVEGDVTRPETLGPAVDGCELVFHAAGFPEQWMRDPQTFDRINAGGTEHMLAAARAAGVKRFVHTSTIDVFTWRPGEHYDESEIDPAPKATFYERSKQCADKLVAESGLDVVFLHPAAVYGAAPSDSAGTNDLMVRLANDKVPALLPGGMPVVYCEDVAEGHVLAAERAASGARFILAERYYTLVEIATEMLAALGLQRKVPRVLPGWVASMVSATGELLAKITKKPPLIPKGQLSFLRVKSYPVGQRAIDELGIRYTPLAEGLRATAAYLRATGAIADRTR